jgi:agmatine/peptidylarginine deiminase
MKKINRLSIMLMYVISISNSFAQHKKLPSMMKILGEAAKEIQKAEKAGTLHKIPSRSYSYNEFQNLPENMRVPGQFEENQAIAITWCKNIAFDSVADTYFYTDTLANENSLYNWGFITADLANAIQQYATVIIRVQDATDTIQAKQIMIARGTPLVNYKFYVQKINDWWDRDSGPISFYYSDQDSIGMVDMDYYTIEALADSAGNVVTDYDLLNFGGRIHDDSIPMKIAQLLNYPVYNTQLNNEGGNLIFDGLQTVWTSTGARFSNRDSFRPPLLDSTGNYILNNEGTWYIEDSTKIAYNVYPQIDDIQYGQLLSNTFGTVATVEPEVFSCDGGTGHLDIYSKLIDENNLALIDYGQAINHDDFDEWNTNLLMFQSLNDANGKPITLHLLPMPLTATGTIQTDCEQDQRTYVNGIFVNKAYIMPVMSDTANLAPADVAAIAAFKKAMPGYRILPINASVMYGTGGSLHCISMQIPAENPVFIRHNALTGNQALLPNYPMTAIVKNKSGLATTKVYYKKSTASTWLSVNMIAGGLNQYNFSIPNTNFMNGDTIQYFIEALSNNGKIMSKPMTAREGGAYRFIVGADVSLSPNETTNFTMSAYPNPTNSTFTLPISIDASRTVEITIMDLSGRVIETATEQLQKGLHLKQFIKGVDFSATGLYIVQTKIDGEVQNTQRVVIQ